MEASELISSQSISVPSPNKTPKSQSPKSPISDLNHPPPNDPDRTPEEELTSGFVLILQNLNLKEKEEPEDEKKNLNEEENVKNLNLKEKEPEDEKKDLNEEENVNREGEGDDEGSNEENEDEIEKEGDDDGGEEVAKDERSCGADDNGSREYQYPVRPESEDCPYYMKTGTCKFGLTCKFNHPVRRKIQMSGKERTKEREELTQRPIQTECKYYLGTEGCKFGNACQYNHTRAKTLVAPIVELNFLGLPIRLGEKECPYYMRNGSCKYGVNCRFNHPDPTAVGGVDSHPGYGNGGSVSLKSASQSVVAPWSSPRALNEIAPFVPMMFSSSQGVPSQNSEWNGYQGEKECPYYMRNGSCKYGVNCRFNHPDPTAVGGVDSHPGYGDGGSVSLKSTSQSVLAPWSSPRALNEIAPFVPMMFSSSQGVPSQNSEWNGYQAPVYPPERSIHPLPAFLMNNVASETSVYTHQQQQQQQQMILDEFPERPGQPECSYYLKTGDCKYKSNCKYHHPKNWISMPPPFTLSDKGLPLRPDQNICTHYGRYGICKFGPACKFDHPAHPAASAVSGMDQPSPFGNSAITQGARMVGIGNGSRPTIR